MSLQKTTLDSLKIDRPPENAESGGMKRVWFLAILLLLGGGAAFVWLQGTHGTEVQTAVARPSGGATESGDGGSRSTVLNASGYVTARRHATVSSKATAKVVEILIEEGMKVEAGQVLARLDTSNVEASLRLAKAQVTSAQVATEETQVLLERAEVELTRFKSLAAQNIASASDLDRADADAKSLRARLARLQQEKVVAEQQVAVWQQEMDDRVVRAPFSGVVISKDAQPGEMISPISAGGGFIRTGIGTLVDMSSLEIEVDVNESFINRVSAGQPVTAVLDSYPDWSIPAKVIAVIPSADRQKATVKVRIGFQQLDPRILPDMGIKVSFLAANEGATGAGAAADGVLLPAAALHKQEGRDVVWVIRGGRVERRAVRWNKNGEGEVTVLAGLTPGEKVVISGPSTLSDGARVKEKNP
jgi:HlyD family secretion protein